MTFRNIPRVPLLLGLAAASLGVGVLLAACGGSSKANSTTAPGGSTADAAAAATATPAAVTRVAPSSSSGSTGLTLGKTQLTQYSATVCDFGPAVSR
ncbi:MAG: hypothetical protein ACRDG3_09780, partial [Tepidiformaceae bacterium]